MFLIKNCNLFILKHPRWTFQLQEEPPAFHGEYTALNNMKFLNFFLLLLFIFSSWNRAWIHRHNWIRIRNTFINCTDYYFKKEWREPEPDPEPFFLELSKNSWADVIFRRYKTAVTRDGTVGLFARLCSTGSRASPIKLPTSGSAVIHSVHYFCTEEREGEREREFC